MRPSSPVVGTAAPEDCTDSPLHSEAELVTSTDPDHDVQPTLIASALPVRSFARDERRRASASPSARRVVVASRSPDHRPHSSDSSTTSFSLGSAPSLVRGQVSRTLSERRTLAGLSTVVFRWTYSMTACGGDLQFTFLLLAALISATVGCTAALTPLPEARPLRQRPARGLLSHAPRNGLRTQPFQEPVRRSSRSQMP